MTGFIDDTKGQINNMESPHPILLQQLIDRMQSNAQLWGNLLHVSGGALEIPKCNHYVMQWNLKLSGIPELNADVNKILHLVTLTNDAFTVNHKH
jgi:hypothetical protein